MENKEMVKAVKTAIQEEKDEWTKELKTAAWLFFPLMWFLKYLGS